MKVPVPMGRRVPLWLLPMAVILLGTCIAGAAGLWLQRQHEAQAMADFARSAARVDEIVKARIQKPIYGLHGARGLYAASNQVQRREFRAFIESRDLPQEFPGVRGFGFIQRVLRADLPAFVAAVRADDAPQFALRELAALDEDDLFVIKFIEPFTPNSSALGLDIGSEPIRREAAERAVATGLPTLTAAITLVQDTRRSTGFLLFLPVFRQGADPTTPAQRRQALLGLLVAPMVVGEILSNMPEVAAGLVHFQLVDTVAGHTIYSSADAGASDATGAVAPLQAGRFVEERKLSLPGRETLLRVRSTPQFDAAHESAAPWLVFSGGVLASALLGAALSLLMRQQVSLRTRAEALAEGMTTDLDRLAQVARHTSNAVLTTDLDQRIVWVNDGYTRLTGASADQVLGQTAQAVFGDSSTGAAALQALGQAIASGQGCRVELPLRALDGREVWLDLDMQPLRDTGGAITGFMHVGSDITAQRLTTRRLEAAQRDNDALLRVIYMHAIVSVADRSGKIIEANDAFCSISGYSREELLQQTHRIVNSGVQPASFWIQMWATIAAGQPWRGEVCNRSKDGAFYWVDTLIAPFVDAEGKVEKYISIRTDITASKNAARELARERQRLDNILEGTHVGTWEWNVETGATVFNERWAQILGYTLAELSPTSIDTWTRFTHPDDLRASSIALERHFDGASPAYECEARMRHRDGHWVWVLDRGKLFSRSDDGRPRWMAGTHMDITERKLAEAALRASQAVLDKTGRIAGVGGWAVELEPLAIRWSDQTCRIHGREPGHQPGMEEAVNYYTPDARAVVALAVQRCIDSGEGFDIELSMVTAQGRLVWVRSVGERECADGQAVRLVGTFQDITARHALEAELRRKSELVTSVIENLPCGLSVFDGELQLVASNSEFRRLLDFPDALFAGGNTRFEDVIRYNAARGEYGPGDVEATVQAIVERARQRVEQHQFERVRPDGTPLEIRGGPMPGGGFVTTYTDISARHHAEQALLEQTERLRLATDSAEIGVWELDPARGIIKWDDWMYRLYGLARADGAQPVDLWSRHLHPDDASRVLAEIAAGLEGSGSFRPEFRIVWGNGEVRHLQAAAQVIRDDAGKALRMIGVNLDVTRQRRSEDDLREAKKVAESASVAKSAFLANMSHEIRTPMNAILGMLALLKKTELTTRQADYTGKTEGAARSLLGLLNDILDFSKVEAGKMTLDPHPFRPDQLLRDLAVVLAANTATKPIEVLFDIDTQLPPVLLGDAMRLQQVLINLGGNAIKFTAEGEVVVSVAVVERDHDTVTLEVAVQDSGIGIAPENQQHIFSGFSQAEASTTRRFGGTGLGLAICQRLVGLMGGELQLHSALGQGSRFHFRIALGIDHEVAGAEVAPLRRRQPMALRVLVVDDKPLARELMQRMAQALGWQVTLADSGQAALACLEAGAAFDAAFIDWQMPGLDGWQTCQRIREHCAQGAAPLLIMVTAHGRDMLSQRSQDEQALVHGFLVKPVTASMLYDAVVDARSDPDARLAARTGPTPAVQRLPGLRLLLVEDNANNQQVARELLEDEGAEVQIADNGLLAVEAVAAADPPFDVVLMDLQMPVMDGYTATTRIRQDLQRLSLPIVAMTANAMASDREACLAAGMNDHVGKPFDLDQLVAVLLRLTGRADVPAPGASAASPAGRPASDTARVLPHAVLAAAAAAGVGIERALARLGGKLKVYGRTLRNFAADLQGLPLKLEEQLQRGDRDALRRELHTLKGVAATVGVTALARLAGDAEAQLAGVQPAADEADCVARVSAAVDTAVASLAPLCTALDGDAPAATATDRAVAVVNALSPAETALLATLLRTVQGLLQASDLDAADALQNLRVRLPAAAGPRFDALEAAVESLEFESALSHCGQWLLECET